MPSLPFAAVATSVPQSAEIPVEHGRNADILFIMKKRMNPATIFEIQILFIQDSNIVSAMIGVLSALRDTKLFQRLEWEGRPLEDSSGDNSVIDLNFVPRTKPEALIAGYQNILDTIYAPQTVLSAGEPTLSRVPTATQGCSYLKQEHIGAFFKSILMLGTLAGAVPFLETLLLVVSLTTAPAPLAMTYAVYGFLFRKVAEKIRDYGKFDDNGKWEQKNGQVV